MSKSRRRCQNRAPQVCAARGIHATNHVTSTSAQPLPLSAWHSICTPLLLLTGRQVRVSFEGRGIMITREESKEKQETVAKPASENRDPLTDEKGAHPVGVGVGTAIGGGVAGGVIGSAAAAAAAGTAGGAAAGPVGAVA